MKLAVRRRSVEDSSQKIGDSVGKVSKTFLLCAMQSRYRHRSWAILSLRLMTKPLRWMSSAQSYIEKPFYKESNEGPCSRSIDRLGNHVMSRSIDRLGNHVMRGRVVGPLIDWVTMS